MGPLLGRTEPRLWRRPRVELTPATSYGFAVVAFARDVLRMPLDPWQEWLVIHAGELLPDGRPRWRHVLVLVARQNGKTHLLVVLALFWLFVEQWPMILGTSTNLDYANESWEEAAKFCDPELVDSALPVLLSRMPPRRRHMPGVKRGNGKQEIRTLESCRYKIGTAARTGGRSLRIDRLIQDELREHLTWEAWKAAINAMNARPFGQSYSLSNMGDDKSVVLDNLRNTAVDQVLAEHQHLTDFDLWEAEFLPSDDGQDYLGLFEWSAPEGSEMLDEQAWCQANPNLGRRVHYDVIAGPARAAAEGTDQEVVAGFKTEVLCMRVKNLDPAVDPIKWAAGHVLGDLAEVRRNVAGFVDLSPDRQHATLSAAAMLPDGRIRVEVVHAWSGYNAADQLRAELPGWVRKVKPRLLGWMPGGPAAAVAADLADRKKKGRVAWPPPGVTVEEIRAEVPAVCMGFAEQVDAGKIIYGDGQELMTTHVTAAAKKWNGPVWIFERVGDGHVDAAYAGAGAVHLARTMPTSAGRIRIVRPKSG